MSAPSKKIVLISGGIAEHQLRLQPWRYLHEVVRQLGGLGHDVTVISDGGPTADREAVQGVSVARIPSVSSTRWQANAQLRALVRRLAPDVLLWHVGLTSFLHQRPAWASDIPTVGIFTSPIYRSAELSRLGLRRIAQGYRLSGAHVLGTLLPKLLVRRSVNQGALRALVVQTEATRRRLLGYGLQSERIRVISPGIDSIWAEAPAESQLRGQLGYDRGDTVVLYFGSPAPLRGLHSLIRALEIARCADASIKLLVLSRRHADELAREDADLARLLSHSQIKPHVRVVSGYLAEAALVDHVAACDVVALPFELVPSDAPLSLLEAQALGKPVITTRIGCLEELVARGPRYLAEPGDPHTLALALRQAASDLRTGRCRMARPPARGWQQMGIEWSAFIQSL